MSEKKSEKTPTPTSEVILKKNENYFFLPRGGARELKLQPFETQESKTTSDCRLLQKTTNSLFSLYHLLYAYF